MLQHHIASLPGGTRILEHQVAGHFHGHSKTGFGALQDLEGRIVLKCLKASPNAPNEYLFYENLVNHRPATADYECLQRLTPKYLGILVGSNDVQYLKLENLCHGFRKPCVKDVKMGCVTFDLDADEKKMRREIGKCPLALQTGFQFVGMKVYLNNRYVYHERRCCRSLNQQQLPHGTAFFYRIHLDVVHARSVISQVIESLLEIEQFVVGQRSFKMFCVSLLVVYEGFSDDDDTCPKVKVKLIDFAHVYTDKFDCVDQNFLTGIRNYRLNLEEIISTDFAYQNDSGHLKECENSYDFECYGGPVE